MIKKSVTLYIAESIGLLLCALVGLGVLALLGIILKAALLGWMDKQGGVFVYAFVGSIVLIYCIVIFARMLIWAIIDAAKGGGLKDTIIGTVVLLPCLIPIVPIIVGGWPIVLLIIMSIKWGKYHHKT